MAMFVQVPGHEINRGRHHYIGGKRELYPRQGCWNVPNMVQHCREVRLGGHNAIPSSRGRRTHHPSQRVSQFAGRRLSCHCHICQRVSPSAILYARMLYLHRARHGEPRSRRIHEGPHGHRVESASPVKGLDHQFRIPPNDRREYYLSRRAEL